MKNTPLLAAAAAALAGCLSTSVPPVSTWTVEFAPDAAGAASAKPAEGAPRGSVRVAQVSVRDPYDAREIAVMRPDGTIAFDHYNRFAARPSALAKGALQDALRAPGAFHAAVPAVSRLAAELDVEASVSRIALDCRREGERTARVEVSLMLLKGRSLYAAADGAGAADAADGDYSRAFSLAFTRAVADALERL